MKDPFKNPFPKGTLFWAVWRGRIGEVWDALANGEGVGTVVEEYIASYIPLGSTALHLAACKGHAGIVECLLDHGADISATDEYDATSLHRAAAAGRINVVKLLLNRGADPNIRDWRGRTPVHCAAYSNRSATIRALRSNRNVEIGIADNRGRTPLSLALQRNYRQAAAALQR